MEAESAALLSVVEEELMSRPLGFALDCHSGFGWDDSIWFPYARTAREMAHLPGMFLLKTMFEESYPIRTTATRSSRRAISICCMATCGTAHTTARAHLTSSCR